jgi:hypothetical protein
MTRGNLILGGILVAVAAIWLLGHDWGRDEPSGPAQRFFPTFNREGADEIQILGGSQGTTWTIARPPDTDWILASAGGYPVKRTEVDRFLDAVQSLRKDNVAGTSAELRERTHTDEKNGRLVRVLRDGQPMAEFYVGNNPKRGYHDFFVRSKDDDTVYRTHTVLEKDRAAGGADGPFGPGGGPSAFDWHAFTEEQSRKWIDPEIWDLSGAEVQEIRLHRRDHFDARVVKEAEDKWNLVEEGKEPVPADADVASGILQAVRRLSLYEVVGKYDDVKEEYGLDAPEITLLMTLRKKVSKPAPKEGEEKKEGEEPKEEWTTFTRTVEVGKKVTRPRYDSYSEETKSQDYYAIRVDPEHIDDPEEKARGAYVFLVHDYTGNALRKELTDLHARSKEEEEKGPGEGEGDDVIPLPGDPTPGGEKKPADEKTGDEKTGDEKTGDEKTGDEKTGDEKTGDEKTGDEKKPADETEKPKDEGCGCGG